jgi:hypothetical protein
VSTPPPQPRTAAWRARAIRLSDRVPTKWFITALSSLFLVASAAFGGLAAVPAPPLPEVQPEDSFSGAQLRISVVGAVLIDAFPEQGIEPTPGNRLLVVRAIVENVWDAPVEQRGGIGASDNVRVEGVDGVDDSAAPYALAIVSDGAQEFDLQPGIPEELAYIWQVPDDALADGELLHVNMLDKVFAAGGLVAYGERFDDPFVAAYTEIAITDVGAGAGVAADDADANGAGQ